MQTLIELKNIEKKYKNESVITNLNFSVSSGEVIGIVGENGSGKTTIMRLIAGMSYPDKGSVNVNGKNITPGELAEDIGVLIDTPVFLTNETGFNNLYYLSKIKNELSKEGIRSVIKKVGLDPDLKKKTKDYSLGMRQRLGIAQAIMEKPKLILFDEPTNGLDVEGVNILEGIIHDLKSEGTSFIFVSHNKEEIERFCDKVYRIVNKELIKEQKQKKWRIVLRNTDDLTKVLRLFPHSKLDTESTTLAVIIKESTEAEELESILKNKDINALEVVDQS